MNNKRITAENKVIQSAHKLVAEISKSYSSRINNELPWPVKLALQKLTSNAAELRRIEIRESSHDR